MIWKGALVAFVLFTLSVTNARAQFGPEITSEPITTATAGVEYVYDVDATNLPKYELDKAPEGMTIEELTGIIRWVPKKKGSYDISVTASALLGSDTQEYVLVVSDSNEPPVITSTAVTTARAKVEYLYDVNATGVPEPEYTLTTAPTGMAIDLTTGLIQWTPEIVGDFDVVIEASNTAGATTQSFTITVADAFAPPEIVSTAVTSVVLGQSYSYDVEANGNPAPTYAFDDAPTGMTIDATSGLIAWTPDTVGTYDVSVRATNTQGSDQQSFTISVSLPLGEPNFTSSPGLEATVGQNYSYDANATGNPTPTFALTDGPPGMTLNATSGQIAWTPAAAGSFNVSILASNSQGEDVQSFTIQASEPLVAPGITSNAIRNATVGQNYSYNVNASGNPNPVYGLSTAPAGMTINAANGVIDWTPAEAGEFAVTVEASNSVGNDTQSFDIEVSEPLSAPTITSTPSTQTFVGQEYTYDLEATGNPSPTFQLTNAPEGMTINAESGLIAWMPNATGTFNVAVRANNPRGSASQLFSINVSQSLASPEFASTPVETATVNQAYRYDVDAVGNPVPTYALQTAPEGMTIQSATGVISWTPGNAGSYDVIVDATNSQGTISQPFSIAVGERLAAPSITSTPITQTIVDAPYSYTVVAAGNPTPTFTLLANPSGMTIDNASGVISWTPRATGSFNVSVQAANSQGSATQLFSLMVDNTSSVAVLQSQSIEINTPTSYTFEAVVNSNGSPTSVTFEYGRDAVNESAVLATPQPIVGVEIPIATTVSNLAEGVTYLFRVTAENSAGKTTGPVQSFTTYQSSYQLGADLPFGPRLDSLGYRLYSVPGDVDLNTSSVLDGEQREDWNIYRDNGQAANFFEEFNGSTLFRFRPGRAFWMLARNAGEVPEQTVSTVDLDRDGTYDLRLQAGWNLIGSPYLLPLPWETVRALNPSMPATAKLWTFDGAFREATVLEPYKGYYYFNDQTVAQTMQLPFPGLYANLGKTDGAPKRLAAAPAARTLRLVAATDSLAASAEIYLSEEAMSVLDRLDQYAPRQAFSGLALALKPAFDTPYGDFALEARPEIVDGAAFDLMLHASPGERIAFSAEGLAAFEDQRVFLMDRATGELTDLHARPTVTLAASAAGYQVLIGSDAFVEDHQATVAPETFQLAPAYPNPFARSTTIAYSLTEYEDVELAVFDVLGREVDVLVRGAQPAGYHEVRWDGASLPNGMYVLRLSTASGPAQVRTMVKVE
ncbi:MAG: putative Ig domain-containing protein [Rhodothermales bacterium]|nr:putative Ig domain-containing protein [Rhodothermales bacterium]